MPSKCELAIVIPVYNEAPNLPALLQDWQTVFNATGASYRMILIDDGSKDDSLTVLQTLAAGDATLEVHTQPNAGHGPAILKGYRMAVDSEWVFQIDSDHQLQTTAFQPLWAIREQYDLLVAARQEKNASAGRNRISSLSRFIVGSLYGRQVKDVNSPYRLMRADKLRLALEKIPADSFAPNILISSWFIRQKCRIYNGVVETRKGPRMRESRVSRYILSGAFRAAWQTVLFRIRS